MYSDAEQTGVGLIRSYAAPVSPPVVCSPAPRSATPNFTPPEYTLLAGSFDSNAARQLALLPRGGSGSDPLRAR